MLLLFLVSGWVATEQVYTERTVIVPDYVPTLGPLRVEVAPEDEEPQPEPYQTAHAKAHPPHLPYQYKVPPPNCDARLPPLCATNSTLTFCLTDEEYPFEDIHAALAEDHLLARQYADEKDQSADDLVAALGRERETSLDYAHYDGRPYAKGNWIGGEGFLCPSTVEYAQPRRARNVRGEWRVLVNDPSHCTQTERIEICLYPEVPCRTLAPCYHSQCVQKYVHHRILSFDPCYPERGIFFDMYALPSACSCRVPSSTSCKKCQS